MAENTAIEWADHTFNPWTGCTKVSPGCDGCYAESWAKRSGTVRWGAGEPRRRTTDANWRLPLKWNAQAEHGGRRFRVFCASLADVFDNDVPQEWRDDLFRLIERTPHLDWLLLTKRIGNVAHQAWPRWMQQGFPRNVWIGATMVDQGEVDRDARKLLALPARVHFISYEPALGPIDVAPWLRPYCDAGSRPHPDGGGVTCPRCGGAGGCGGLSWVIAGGESGSHARPAHPDWFRSLREQCAAAGVPFMFKQWGEWGPDWEGAETCQACGRTKFDAVNSRGECGHCGIDGWMAANKPLDKLCRVGKKAAGRQLDGRTHDGFPA